VSAASIAERVNAGAAWLDQHQPGWVDRIDLDRLNLEATCHCILGQLHGDYYEALDDLGRRVPGQWTAEGLGFNASTRSADEEYDELTAAWRQLIEQRRAES
jgi:hypothetical protein